MIPLLIGVLLAVAMAAGARLLRFDTDRSYYAAVLIVIASYYVLFAFMATAPNWQTVVIETTIAGAFGILAITGALRWPVLIGVGILLHGVFDFFHSSLITNDATPPWWPAFCGGVDVVLGCWVLWSVKRGDALLTLGGRP